MKVLVTGDREWSDIQAVIDVLEMLPERSVVIHGAALGADTIAGLIAVSLGHVVREYPADWKKFGRPAGPIRNREMLAKEHVPTEPIELVLAFHNDLQKSRGTKDMVSCVKKAGIPWVLCVSGMKQGTDE